MPKSGERTRRGDRTRRKRRHSSKKISSSSENNEQNETTHPIKNSKSLSGIPGQPKIADKLENGENKRGGISFVTPTRNVEGAGSTERNGSAPNVTIDHNHTTVVSPRSKRKYGTWSLRSKRKVKSPRKTRDGGDGGDNAEEASGHPSDSTHDDSGSSLLTNVTPRSSSKTKKASLIRTLSGFSRRSDVSKKRKSTGFDSLKTSSGSGSAGTQSPDNFDSTVSPLTSPKGRKHNVYLSVRTIGKDGSGPAHSVAAASFRAKMNLTLSPLGSVVENCLSPGRDAAIQLQKLNLNAELDAYKRRECEFAQAPRKADAPYQWVLDDSSQDTDDAASSSSSSSLVAGSSKSELDTNSQSEQQQSTTVVDQSLDSSERKKRKRKKRKKETNRKKRNKHLDGAARLIKTNSEQIKDLKDKLWNRPKLESFGPSVEKFQTFPNWHIEMKQSVEHYKAAMDKTESRGALSAYGSRSSTGSRRVTRVRNAMPSNQPKRTTTTSSSAASSSRHQESETASLVLQKFTECTDTERSFTHLNITINPLLLSRQRRLALRQKREAKLLEEKRREKQFKMETQLPQRIQSKLDNRDAILVNSDHSF